MSDTEDDFSVCSSLDSPTNPAEPVFPVDYEESVSKSNIGADKLVREREGTVSNNVHNSFVNKPVPKEVTHSLKETFPDNRIKDTNSVTQNSQNGHVDSAKNSNRHERKSVELSWNCLYDNSVEDDIFSFDAGNSCKPGEDPNRNKNERHPSTSSLSSASSQPCCIYENPVHDSPKHHQRPYPSQDDTQAFSATSAGAEKGMARPLPPIDVTRKISISSRKNSVPLTPLTPLTKSVIPLPKSKIPSPQEVASSQYIFVAAQQISEAQQHEQQRDYQEALNLYREGVGTLLQGVQGKYLYYFLL